MPNRAKKTGSKSKRNANGEEKKVKVSTQWEKSRKKRKRGLSLKRQLLKFLLQKKKRNKFLIHCLFVNNFFGEKSSA